ncbi:hypothetical protein C1645_840200 [Glomus cerebriforme]|uniref:Uncharacterized protein n=1 Tax=Glomus cerebriforme TaxID=658196 RepID=A0A397S4K9_9GLOM|nr:hypothetical protein C1645_840200 [Glomus cerebriforme]
MHAIKRYVKIGYDLTEGKNIEIVLQDLSGTLSWPITGQFAGCIHAHSLPHIGEWIDFSSVQITNLCNIIYRSSPIVLKPTESHTSWIMLIPSKKK